jgi:hypothetical protein
VCARKAAPELLIVGDSRAVAGVSVQQIRAAGIDAEKFALGGSGVFTGWAVLDRLVDCGVKPKHVVMAFGTVHMLDTGALMDRTTNYDLLKGPRAGHAYEMAAEWDASLARRLTYKAVSVLGTEATLVDLVLMRPALKNVLEKPALAVHNAVANEEERTSFLARGGDRFYGQDDRAKGLPDEKDYGADHAIPQMNYRAAEAIAELGKAYGFGVSLYVLPVSETARSGLPAELFATADGFRETLDGMGIAPLNSIWTLPDTDFGDPSHVNARGREIVTQDFLKRFRSMAGELAGGRGNEADHAVSLSAQEIEKVRQ